MGPGCLLVRGSPIGVIQSSALIATPAQRALRPLTFASPLAEFKALEAQLAEQLKQLNALKNDEGLKREIEFESKLRALMAEYGMNLRGIITLLDPHPLAKDEQKASGRRRERQVKTYKNPHTGENVQTKGGNHKVLEAWKAEFGASAVDGWLQ